MVNPHDMRYMLGMAKQTKYPVRKLSYFSDEMAKAIDDFRYSQRIPSENEAIRQLIQTGLDLPRLCIDLLDAIEAKRLLDVDGIKDEVAALDAYLGTSRNDDVPQK